MKATIKVGNFTIQCEGEKLRDLLAEMGEVSSVFCVTSCGLCKSVDIAPNVREFDGNTFYEFSCNECGGQRKISINKDDRGNRLFLRWTDQDGNQLPNQGWSKWERLKGTPVSPNGDTEAGSSSGFGGRDGTHAGDPTSGHADVADDDIPF